MESVSLESNYDRSVDREINLQTLSTAYVNRDVFELLLNEIISTVSPSASSSTTSSSEASAALIEAMGYSVGVD